MQIQRVRGRDLREALRRAEELVGANALVLSHETMHDGGVTVAVARNRETNAPPKRADAGLADVERAMRRSGCSTEWIERTLQQVEASGERGPFALDAAARVLGQSVPLAPPRQGPTRPFVLALVGPAGVGKTTTVVKLAAHLARAGRRVGLIALDTERAGAVEPLTRLASLIQAPFDLAAHGAALRGAIERSLSRDVVLVDTRGDARADAQALGELAGVPSHAVYLVAAATTNRAALDESTSAFAASALGGLVITKLDETRAPAGSLEFAAAAGLPLAFLCDGRSIGAHLHRADSERVADLFLRGKLAQRGGPVR